MNGLLDCKIYDSNLLSNYSVITDTYLLLVIVKRYIGIYQSEIMIFTKVVQRKVFAIALGLI